MRKSCYLCRKRSYEADYKFGAVRHVCLDHLRIGEDGASSLVAGGGRELRVDHSVLDIAVFQPVANEGDVCASVEKVSRDRVAQGMGFRQ